LYFVHSGIPEIAVSNTGRVSDYCVTRQAWRGNTSFKGSLAAYPAGYVTNSVILPTCINYENA
jgi:hypothetical protein